MAQRAPFAGTCIRWTAILPALLLTACSGPGAASRPSTSLWARKDNQPAATAQNATAQNATAQNATAQAANAAAPAISANGPQAGASQQLVANRAPGSPPVHQASWPAAGGAQTPLANYTNPHAGMPADVGPYPSTSDPAPFGQRLDTQPAAAAPPAATTYTGAANDAGSERPVLEIFDPTVTIATVGNQYILRGELEGDANVMLAPHIEKLDPAELAEKRIQILADRDRLARQLLLQAIERKLMYLEFLRTIPDDKRKEAMENISRRVGEAFDEELDEMIVKVRQVKDDNYEKLSRQDPQLFRLAFLMKETNLQTHLQLDELLRRYGSSLFAQKQSFAETALGRQAIGSMIDRNPEVTHEELLTYYRENAEEFEVPPQARWEQLTARFDHFNSRDECRSAIAAMGNEVFLGGAPFSAVAKRASHGKNADEGGYHDWTDWGDLEISREIRDAVFSLPPGELSQIIEDSEGYHIVRVIEQRDAHMTSFTDAQSEIRDTLKSQKRGEQVAKAVEKLRERTPIWTIYDAE